MGKVYPEITERVRTIIEKQKLFFVATAPLSEAGHINLSPKGLDSFAILDTNTVAYLDLTGSAAETVAHLRENGRIVLMFCAFEGPPLIVRLHGNGEVIEPEDEAYVSLLEKFPGIPGVRAIIRVKVSRVSDSCGYGVPLYQFEGEREQLPKWVAKKGVSGIRDYQRENNARSLDGLPTLRNLD